MYKVMSDTSVEFLQIPNPIVAIDNEDRVCWKPAAGLRLVAPWERDYLDLVRGIIQANCFWHLKHFKMRPRNVRSKWHLRKLYFAHMYYSVIPLRRLENPKAFGKIGAAIGDQGKGEGGQGGWPSHLEDGRDRHDAAKHGGPQYDDAEDDHGEDDDEVSPRKEETTCCQGRLPPPAVYRQTHRIKQYFLKYQSIQSSIFQDKVDMYCF